MFKTRSLVAFLLVAILLFPCFPWVSAITGTEQIDTTTKNAVNDVLRDIEPQKDLWGLATTDFGQLRISNAIQTYEYKNDTFVAGHEMYPILSAGKVVLWAIPVNGHYQIMTGLATEVNDTISPETAFALVYDKSNVYLYVNGNFALLEQFSKEISTRSILDPVIQCPPADIAVTPLSQGELLGYTSYDSLARGTSYSYYCSVNFVTQNPPSDMCWAASAASIVNYLKGTSLTAIQVARNYHGSNYDQPIEYDELTDVLDNYGVLYDFAEDRYHQYGFDEEIMKSLSADYPIGGSFHVSNGGKHCAVIHGINIMAGRIQVMDPETGFLTVHCSGNTYSYVSSIYGTTLTLIGIAYMNI